jgi:hypothetical protein
MDEVTQQNAALVEEAAAAAGSLEDQAEQLRAAVAVFRTSGSAGGLSVSPKSGVVTRAAKPSPLAPAPVRHAATVPQKETAVKQGSPQPVSAEQSWETF